MRTTERQTTIAILREITGEKVPAWAELLGCSPSTVKSLESGRLGLSERLLSKLVRETNISPAWVMTGNLTAPPVTRSGEPFTKQSYERHRASLTVSSGSQEMDEFFLFWSGPLCAQLMSIASKVSNTSDHALVSYKIEKLLDELADEYGLDPEIYPHKAYDGLHFIESANACARLMKFYDQHFSAMRKAVRQVPGLRFNERGFVEKISQPKSKQSSRRKKKA